MNGKTTNQELLKFEEDLMIIKDLMPTVLGKKDEYKYWYIIEM